MAALECTDRLDNTMVIFTSDHGDAALSSYRDDVYSEYYNASIMFQTPDPPGYVVMLCTEHHKLLAMHGRDGGERYHLDRDPLETCNLWDESSYAEIKVALLQRLCDRFVWTMAPLPILEVRW